MKGLLFGTAGVPVSCPSRSSVDGVSCVKGLGLDAMEVQFVRGVKMGLETAESVGLVAKKKGVVLTAHAPYYVNLLSDKEDVYEKSIQRIVDTVKVLDRMGGWSVVFHAGYYGGKTMEEGMRRVREALHEILDRCSPYPSPWIRAEVSGKPTQWGALDEVVAISEEFDRVLPCIDFAHLHARTNGQYNSREEWERVLEEIEARLGREALENMHVHVSGIEYTEKGERRHLNLDESDLMYEELVRVWKDFGVKGVVISESPNIEGDALVLKGLWTKK